MWKVPNLGLLRNLYEYNENATKKGGALVDYTQINESPRSEWIFMFPEVNIWTPATSHLQNVNAFRLGAPQFQNVLYPRFPSLREAVTQLGPSFTLLHDLTISYSIDPKQGLSLVEFFSGKEIVVDVHVQTISLKPLRRKRQRKFEKLIEKRWKAKDAFLSSIQKRVSKEEGEYLLPF